MIQTTLPGQPFPKVRINQHNAGDYFCIVANDPDFGEQPLMSDDGFRDSLIKLGWFESSNVAVFLMSHNGEGVEQQKILKKFRGRYGLVKEVFSQQGTIPYGDIRAALGMPREQQFAIIREVTISLSFPYAMNALPDATKEDLLRRIHEEIQAYVNLGQEELHIYHRFRRQTIESDVSIIIIGKSNRHVNEVAVVTDRNEWDGFRKHILQILDQAKDYAINFMEVGVEGGVS